MLKAKHMGECGLASSRFSACKNPALYEQELCAAAGAWRVRSSLGAVQQGSLRGRHAQWTISRAHRQRGNLHRGELPTVYDELLCS